MIASFGLTNERGGLGLSCTPAGLSLAGAPLLRKAETGFAPRSTQEVAALIDAAYGADPTRLLASLSVIAEAINRGELARAMIAAVQTRTPELSREAAARVARADVALAKFDPNQPRDWHGRWSLDGGARPTPAASAQSDEKAMEDRSRAAAALVEAFEKKYDDLGPVEFAKQVIQFGDRLRRQGKNLSPDEKERALAESAFLQDRLSFWLDYDYKPATAHLNLLSAALTLHQGAVNGGIVSAGEIPRSMLDVAGAAWALGSLAPRLSSAREPVVETAPVGTPEKIKGIGDVAPNDEVQIVRGKAPPLQGEPWEVYLEANNPGAGRGPRNRKTFDLYNPETREAISAKTMDTLTVKNIANPQRTYEKLKGYIDEAAEYTRGKRSDLDPKLISSKTIQLAVPEYTSPEQWRHLYRGVVYGKERGVRVVITRIRE
jgi:hypothetical protein